LKNILEKLLYMTGELKMPPEILYHGTTEEAYKQIQYEGLKPMSRNYVHLSIELATAQIVAARHHGAKVILKVNALEAWNAGIHFWYCNDTTWDAEAIPVALQLK